MSRALEARAWTRRVLASTRKRRRLTFVGAMSPGVILVAAAPQVSQDPAWLGLGLLLLFGALIASHLSAPRMPSADAQGSSDSARQDNEA
jgi:hypothetical protein